MARNFHETYSQASLEPPSERSTGLTFGAVAMLIALLWRNTSTISWLALAIGLSFVIVSLTAPGLLRPLNLLWFKFGVALQHVVNPVVMFAMFVLIFTPAGLIMRVWHDPLGKGRKKRSSSYWIDRKTDENRGNMTHQF
jgi:hypothetical protein